MVEIRLPRLFGRKEETFSVIQRHETPSISEEVRQLGVEGTPKEYHQLEGPVMIGKEKIQNAGEENAPTKEEIRRLEKIASGSPERAETWSAAQELREQKK